MPSVTGFTAARSQAIEDSAIVNGTVSGDNLILVRHDGTTIDAGSVRGPQGIQGPGGADILGLMELLSPVGHMVPYGGAVAPTGWLICDGSSLLRTDFSDLYNAIGVNYGAADSTHFSLPDIRQKFPIGKSVSGAGSTLGSSGGSKDAFLPSHAHYHAHAITIGNAGAHSHAIAGDTGNRILVTIGSSTIGAPPFGGGDIPVTWTALDAAPDHYHAAAAGADATAIGGDPTDQNLPAYTVVNYIIRY